MAVGAVRVRFVEVGLKPISFAKKIWTQVKPVPIFRKTYKLFIKIA
jgi:hypothetical protein